MTGFLSPGRSVARRRIGVAVTAAALLAAGWLGTATTSADAATGHPAARSGSATALKSVRSSRTPTPVVHLPKQCRTKARTLCANKTNRTLYFVEHGTVVKTMDAAFGCPGALATREGTFRVFRKNLHWVSTIYHTPMPYAMFFSGGQAVHYSAYFHQHHHHCSHGCVNIRDKKTLAWVFKRIKVGDRVVVYRTSAR